jgi:ribosomal protein L37AE/L43A
MTITEEYSAMALAVINDIPISKWPTHQQEQIGRPREVDAVRAMISTRSIEQLEGSASRFGTPARYVRGVYRVIRWWAGEKLPKRETKTPSCEHPAGKIKVESGLRVCQQCGWEV